MPHYSPTCALLRWKLLLLSLGLAAPQAIPAQSVFINEFHYDNTGADSGEGIEIAGPADTNLADYEIILYNGGTAAPYGSPVALTGTIPNQSAGYGTIWFPLPADGLQNGGNDGFALRRISTSQVVQFLSYEGVLTANSGAAFGLTSTDVGVVESSSTAVGHSLQLQGTGSTITNFHWAAPQAATPGQINTGQIFTASPYQMSFAIAPDTVPENGGASAATGTIILTPAPATPVNITLSHSDATEITVPAAVLVPISGTATFPIGALPDGIADGNQIAFITVTDAAGFYPERQASILVTDVDLPPVPQYSGILRVACLNVLNGVGAPSSPEFNGVLSVLGQISPDIVAFEEVSDANGFSDLKTMLGQFGWQSSRTYLATDGDNFSGQPYVSGDFGSGTQSVALASRYPIVEAVQIGRGVAGRKELTRYPLFVRLDVPELAPADDPALVVVHLKANGAGPQNPTPEADQFRRLLETYRISEFLTSRGINGTSSNLFILGDFNENTFPRSAKSYSTAPIIGGYVFPDGTSLPISFQLGSDLAGVNATTLTYDSTSLLFPFSALAGLGLSSPVTRQADGAQASYNLGDSQIDYIFARQTLVSTQLARTEIYNSRLEHAFDGLPKRQSLPDPESSYTTSDHFAVYGDFALATIPKLSLIFSTASALEGQDTATSLTLTLSAAPQTPLNVSLSSFRPGRLSFPASVTVPAGQQSLTIPVEILHPGAVEPHRFVSVSASAVGWFPSTAKLEVRNVESSGLLLITQYQEPATTGSKAIEVMNRSSTTIDFAKTPLNVRGFANGDSLGQIEARVEEGTLEPGRVLVISDGDAGELLLARGIITPNNGFTPSAANAPAAFFDSAGRMTFYRDSFSFNGDDALELVLNYVRTDVFGRIGQDPGTAWTGAGVSSQGQNLQLRDSLSTPSEGFMDPSSRFTTAGTNDQLTGFGLAPVFTDPYASWLSIYGIADLAGALMGDPDLDGFPNLIEYSLALDPTISDKSPFLVGVSQNALTVSFRRRVSEVGLHFFVEQSSDLTTWTQNGVSQSSVIAHGDGSETVAFAVSAQPSRVFLRLRVTRD